MNHTLLSPRLAWCNAVLLVATAGAIAALPNASAKPPKEERREMKREANDAAPAKSTKDDAPTRAASKLREQMDVADDAEWEVISERIAHVTELRRVLSGGAGVRGVAIADKVKPNSRADRTAQQEQDALRMAVRDKLPDAEIRARLARAHDVHRQNEAKLTKAQEELRAVLTVRQEAVAVVAGLLPP
jgi:hypothetical protein